MGSKTDKTTTAAQVTAKIREMVGDPGRFPISVADKMAFLNTCVDADYVAVTPAAQIYEYEVKVTRADFLRDFKKKRHEIYSGGFASKIGGRGRRRRRPLLKPNRFYYVTAPGIITGDDLPDYAGWFEFDPAPGAPLVERRRAPLLWRGTHEMKKILQLAAAMKRRGT